MRQITISGLLLIAALFGCAKVPPAGKDLSGNWEPISAKLSGIDLPIASFGGAHLKLTEDSYDFAGDQGTFTLLASSEPPAKMDIMGKSGPNAGKIIPTIYKLEGDELTICYQLAPSAERPPEFVSPAESRVLLITYKRMP